MVVLVEVEPGMGDWDWEGEVRSARESVCGWLIPHFHGSGGSNRQNFTAIYDWDGAKRKEERRQWNSRHCKCGLCT